MLAEQHFKDVSRYPKVIDPEWDATVAEYLERVGATNLDAPNAPKRKVPRTDAQLRELEGIEKAKAEKKAQAEYQEAQARLADGTAVHRQPKGGTVIQSTEAVSKPKQAKRGRKLGSKAGEYKEAKERRAPILAQLKAGEFIKVLKQSKGEAELREYSQQYSDISHIRSNLGLKVSRVRCNQTKQSFYAIDAFPRHQSDVTISGMTNDKKSLLQALLSRELVLASDLACPTKMASRTILKIMREHDLDVYTVFDGATTEGWIFIPNKEKQQAKVSELGDILQGLDFLKERQAKEGQ